jgi:hypothetical protein
VVTLGQVDPGVVDSLYGEVGFPSQGSGATLTGRSWFLQSGAHPEHRFTARLMTCIAHAQGNVTKIVACQRK